MKLVVAEKPIAARRIAVILSDGNMQVEKKNGVEYFVFGETVVIPMKGHILDVAFPEKYGNWRTTDLFELAKAELEYIPTHENITVLLKELGKEASELIIATDYDREGESIGKEAIQIILSVNPKIRIKRARFSAITKEEILHAFEQLAEFDENLADSADSRREIDLLWGAVLTRYISLTSGRVGNSFLSAGRVQTPTLSLIVQREKEIRSFIPEDYWVPEITCEKNGIVFTATHKEIWKKQELKSFPKSISRAEVVSVSKRKTETKPPTPFNTTDFLRAASLLGFSPAHAMSIAERLYMNGYISYPRTDNTVYPESIKLEDILQQISFSREFGELAKRVLSQEKIVPTRGKKKTTDHPPIHPVGVASKKELSSQEWKIYELIVRRFLATLYKPLVAERTKAILNANGFEFVARGSVILEPGWFEMYHYSKIEENILPELSEGEVLKVRDFRIHKKQTKPKPRYSAASLIKEMEKLGLGTKSTRAEIIQKLINRTYIRGKKSFEPSNISYAVIDVLEEYVPDITKPDMTAKLEREMDLVEQGKKTKKEVVEESRDILLKILAKLLENQEEISDKLKTALRSDKILGKCPSCGGELMILRSRRGKRFVGCTGFKNGCNVTAPLPGKGSLEPTGTVCDYCGYPVIRVRFKKGRPWLLCINPNCPSKRDKNE